MRKGTSAVDVYYITGPYLVFLSLTSGIVLPDYEHSTRCKFNVLTAVNMKRMVFLEEVLCSLFDRYQCFEETCSFHLQGERGLLYRCRQQVPPNN
jgi:hypothetical protein